MRAIRPPGWVPEDDALDTEYSSGGATHLQTNRVRDRARGTASQLREGSYGRDLGTRPVDDSIAGLRNLSSARNLEISIKLRIARNSSASVLSRQAMLETKPRIATLSENSKKEVSFQKTNGNLAPA